MPTWRRVLLAHGAVFLLFTALTVPVLWPVVRDLGGTTAGWEGDNVFCIRQMWWMKHALVDLRTSPFFDPAVYYPAGYEVAHGPILAANTIGGLPLTVLFGPLVSYNLMVLLSFPLTGFGVYLWVTHLTGSRPAGFVAGTIAAFLPYRFAHIVGHMHMMTTQWIPFAFYAFEHFREAPCMRWAVALGVALGLVALSDWYYAYATGLMLPIYVLARTRPWRPFWTQRTVWRGLAITSAVGAVMVVPLLVPYLRLAAQAGLNRSFEDMAFWALNPYDFFALNTQHPVWGRAVEAAGWFPRQNVTWVERNIMVGWVAAGFAVVGILHRRRSPATAAWILIGAASFLVALGPTLHWNDRQVALPVPALVSQGIERLLAPFPSLANVRSQIATAQATPIPLPSLFLYLLVPGTAGMRVMARFGLWTGLMTSALAGLGVAVMLGRLRRHQVGWALQMAVVVLICGLVLFESWTKFPTMPMHPRKVDQWLARQPADIAVIELPLEQGSRPLQDYYQSVHQRNWIFGPNFAFTPRIRVERQSILATFPSPSSIDALRSWKTTYVLFTPGAIPNWPALRASVETSGAFAFVGILGEVWVYRLGQP